MRPSARDSTAAVLCRLHGSSPPQLALEQDARGSQAIARRPLAARERLGDLLELEPVDEAQHERGAVLGRERRDGLLDEALTFGVDGGVVGRAGRGPFLLGRGRIGGGLRRASPLCARRASIATLRAIRKTYGASGRAGS